MSLLLRSAWKKLEFAFSIAQDPEGLASAYAPPDKANRPGRVLVVAAGRMPR